MFNSLTLNTRIAAAAFGALAIGATAFSVPAAAAPLPLFPFFLPQIEAAPPPVQAVPQDDEDRTVELPAHLHRTNATEPIGSRVSPGCLRRTTEDVSDLYSRVGAGTKLIVLPMTYRRADLGRAIR